MRLKPLSLAFAFAALLGLQALHGHSAHESGFYAPHTDCVYCSGAPAVQPRLPAERVVAVLASVSQTLRPTSGFFTLVEKSVVLPFGRAPPSLSFFH